MLLSTKGEYGVRCMLDLALRYGEGPVSASDISIRQGISRNYVTQLLVRLRRAGLINSVRGAKGGYLLACKPTQIRVGDILRTLEGPIVAAQCLRPRKRKYLCKRIASCVPHILWKRVTEKINELLDSTTLADLCEKNKYFSTAGSAYPMFFQI